MKLQPGQVSGALKNSTSFVGLLVYGEDWGLARDRARGAIHAVIGREPNPFRLATLTKEEHGRLRTEASGLALGGGRRVVYVQDAGDSLVSSLEKLDTRPADTLVLLEAGELTPRSKLRAYAERHQSWGAIPCYLSNAGRTLSEIESALSAAGLSATPEAMAFLTEELAGESMARRSELEKLVLFAAGERVVDLDTARASCSRSLDASLAGAVAAALSGQSVLCDDLMAELGRDGATGAGVVASLSNQLQRLLKIRLLVDGGQSFEEACRSLSPPIYPRQVAGVIRDAERWRASALEALGRAAREADAACKRAASPDFAIAGRLLTTVAGRFPPRE